jgi:hypothetical protein
LTSDKHFMIPFPSGNCYEKTKQHVLTYINKKITRNLLDLEVEVADEVQEQVRIFH